jgi:hypothetical protein
MLYSMRVQKTVLFTVTTVKTSTSTFSSFAQILALPSLLEVMFLEEKQVVSQRGYEGIRLFHKNIMDLCIGQYPLQGH